MESIKERLQLFPQFKDKSDSALDWLIENSKLQEVEKGSTLFKAGDPISHMYILLEGKMVFLVNQNGHYSEAGNVKELEITGALPFSRATTAQGDGYAKTDLKVLSFPRELFKEMIQEHYELVEPLVHTMSSRVREFTTSILQNEKMISLGKISAGLSHELNNPSAAIIRSSSELKKHLTTVPDRFKRVISIRLEPEQVDEVNNLLFAKAGAGINHNLTLIERNEKEDEIAEFLEDNGMSDVFSFAETFVEFSLYLDDLQKIKSVVTEKYFVTVVEWLQNVLITEKLVAEIHQSARRINDLVTSVKSYSHMDRSPDKQEADLHEGIRNTITILQHKLKNNGIEYVEDFFPGLPKVKMFVGEINQVWTNLIDNAIDAMESGGRLKIKTYIDGNNAAVDIEDSGKGIPDDIKTRIFDPFFTTKEIGKGTGLGLDMVRKIINNHRGSIDFSSEPGKTVFTVNIPLN